MTPRHLICLLPLLLGAPGVHADATIVNGGMEGQATDHSNGQGFLLAPPGWTPVNVNTGRGDRLSVEGSDRPGAGQCLRLKTFGSDAGVYQSIVPLTPDRSYLISAWVKRLSGTLNLECYPRAWGPAIMRGLDSQSEGWTKLTVGFTAKDAGVHLYLVAAPQAEFLIDDVEIHPAAVQVRVGEAQPYDFSGRWRYPVTLEAMPGAAAVPEVSLQPVSEVLPRESYGDKQRLALPAGRPATTVVTVPVNVGGRFVVEVTDPATGMPLGVSATHELLGNPWLIAYPCKDSLYASLQHRWPMRVSLVAGGGTPMRGLAAGATIRTTKGRTVRSFTAPAADRALTLSLDGSGLAAGDYRLKLAVRDAAGRHVYEAERPLRVLARQPHEVVVGPDGRTLVDGQSFFPIGLYWVLADPVGWQPGPQRKAEQLLELRRMGFNTLHTYAFEHNDAPDTDDNAVAYLDMAQELGFKVMMGLRRDWCQGDQLNREAIEQRVRRLRGHPALLCWTLWDEPDGNLANVPRVQAIYDLVNREDPYHPAMPVFMSAGGRAFRNAADINLFDYYPGGGAAATVPEVLARSAAALPDKPMWYVARAYQQGQNLPTEQEMMSYWRDALAADVKAIWWYSYGGDKAGWDSIRITPEHFANVKRVVRALADEVGEK